MTKNIMGTQLQNGITIITQSHGFLLELGNRLLPKVFGGLSS